MKKMRIVFCLALVGATLLGATTFAPLLQAQTPAKRCLILVRHAEKDLAAKGDNPPLSAKGKTRAQDLAPAIEQILARENAAKPQTVYVTEYDRTKQTAQPLAAALKLNVVVINAKDVEALVKALRNEKSSVVVVGHSNTIPDVVTQLMGEQAAPIDEREYNKIFIVTIEGRKKGLFIETYGGR